MMNIIFIKITVQLLSLVFLAGVHQVEGNYPKRPREVIDFTELECSHEMNLESGYPTKPEYELHNVARKKAVRSLSTSLDLETTGSFVKSAPGKEVWEFYLKTRDNIKKWRSDYLEQSVTKANASEIDKKLNDAINGIKNLVFKRIRQLEKIAYEGSEALSEDIVLLIFEKVETEWISSFADAGNIRNILKSSKHNGEYQSLIRCWIQIALDFLVDSKNLGIVSEKSIKLFLKKTNGKFVSDYISDHFDPTDLDFRTCIFDIKLSLNEAPFFQKVSKISKFLDHEGWEKIELRFLAMQINKSYVEKVEEVHLNNDLTVFLETARSFVQRISPEGKSPESQAVLEDLLELIASESEDFDDGEFLEKVEYFKLFYDTLRIIMRYQSRNISTKFLEDYQKTASFQKVRFFEEKIGLYYSLTHAILSKSNEAMNHIKKEIPGQTQLNKEISELKEEFSYIIYNPVDSNENRQISNFIIFKTQKEFPQEAGKSNHQDIPLTDIPRYLHSGESTIINSDEQLIDQFERYLDQLNAAGGSQNITVLKNLITKSIENLPYCLDLIIESNRHLFDFEQKFIS